MGESILRCKHHYKAQSSRVRLLSTRSGMSKQPPSNVRWNFSVIHPAGLSIVLRTRAILRGNTTWKPTVRWVEPNLKLGLPLSCVQNVVYDDFIANFTGALFNASEWLNLFDDAGAKYFIITTVSDVRHCSCLSDLAYAYFIILIETS